MEEVDGTTIEEIIERIEEIVLTAEKYLIKQVNLQEKQDSFQA
jgi:hypothetical protein